MTEIIVSPAAAEGLARMVITHSLPADTLARFKRSIEPLAEFPRLGRALEGGGFDGLRFLLGPWRWLIVIYAYEEVTDQVWILTVEDARASSAATSYRA